MEVQKTTTKESLERLYEKPVFSLLFQDTDFLEEYAGKPFSKQTNMLPEYEILIATLANHLSIPHKNIFFERADVQGPDSSKETISVQFWGHRYSATLWARTHEHTGLNVAQTTSIKIIAGDWQRFMDIFTHELWMRTKDTMEAEMLETKINDTRLVLSIAHLSKQFDRLQYLKKGLGAYNISHVLDNPYISFFLAYAKPVIMHTRPFKKKDVEDGIALYPLVAKDSPLLRKLGWYEIVWP